MKQLAAVYPGRVEFFEPAFPIADRSPRPDGDREDSAELIRSQAATGEMDLVQRLRNGDEAAFTGLVDRLHGSLIRLAMAHVSDRSVAEEVVQDTWIGVLEGLDRFEGRSSIRTWIFRILINKAKTRGVRESRHVSFSPLPAEDDSDEPSVDPSRFHPTGAMAGSWVAAPHLWDDATPEKLLLSKETGAFLERAIDALPPSLRQVLVLRDVEGVESEELCKILGITETNLYVRLHRARSRVRKMLEQYVKGEHQPG
jgi:RNA polymerase sigma-70 factor (ECF subfamily)